MFVGDLHSFAADLIDNPQMFFELYRKHVFWGKKRDPDLVPVRFFVNDAMSGSFRTYERLFDHVRPAIDRHHARITDFMLVDNLLVYGRDGEYHEDKVTLRMSTEPEIVSCYDKTFPRIWSAALTLEELAEKVEKRNYPGFDRGRREDFVNLCKIAESKLDIVTDYGRMFPPEARMGRRFFEKVCQYISSAEGLVVAIDRADKKAGDFWEAWETSYEYSNFHEACKDAVRKGAQVYRLFILEKRISQNIRERVERFVRRNLEDGIRIGFTYSSSVVSPDLELKYTYDFILVNMPLLTFSEKEIVTSRDYRARFDKTKDVTLGFELLGDQSFIAAGLSWQNNLIAKRLLIQKLDKFRKLWMSGEVRRVESLQGGSEQQIVRDLFREGM